MVTERERQLEDEIYRLRAEKADEDNRREREKLQARIDTLEARMAKYDEHAHRHEYSEADDMEEADDEDEASEA